MTKAQYNGPWQKLRLQILARDNGLCQIRRPGCTTTATHVDHIVPVMHGGQWWNPDNLRAACQRCNIAAGNQARKHPAPSRQW